MYLFFASGSVADMSLLELDNSLLCYPLEETLAAEVAQHITLSLQEASSSLGCSKLILPDLLLHNISQELLHLASNEPCGLRGALIDLWVDEGCLCAVDQIAVEPTLVPTFQVTLILRLDASGLWPKVQKLFKGSTSPQVPTKHRRSLKLSTSFRAIKRKLYSSGELLIEECCWPSIPVTDRMNNVAAKGLLHVKLTFLKNMVWMCSINNTSITVQFVFVWCSGFPESISRGSYSPDLRWIILYSLHK